MFLTYSSPVVRNKTCLRLSYWVHLAFLVLWGPTALLTIKEEREQAVGLIKSPKSICDIWDINTLKNYSFIWHSDFNGFPEFCLATPSLLTHLCALGTLSFCSLFPLGPGNRLTNLLMFIGWIDCGLLVQLKSSILIGSIILHKVFKWKLFEEIRINEIFWLYWVQTRLFNTIVGFYSVVPDLGWIILPEGELRSSTWPWVANIYRMLTMGHYISILIFHSYQTLQV